MKKNIPMTADLFIFDIVLIYSWDYVPNQNKTLKETQKPKHVILRLF